MASHLLFGVGVFTLTLGVVLAGIMMDPDSTLYNVDRTLFATKTAYDWVTKNGARPFVDNADMTLTVEGRTCTAIHVNMLMRHGSRNPGDNNIVETNDLAKKISENKGPNADGALSFIDGWTSELKPADGAMLNALGIQEMQQMGKRLGARFKQLLQSVDIDRTEFISSSKQRTKDSGKYFSQGLTNYLYITTDTAVVPSTDNRLLRAYKNCDKYDKEVGDNEATTMEVDKFKNMKTFKDMVKSIRTRLDLNASASLSNDDVEYIWEMCAFELMAGRDATWCLMMNDAERKVSSFAKDLENFYADSYGNPVSGKIHCVVLKKMYTLMDEAVAAHQAGTSNYKVGSFMFGHSNTILGLATTFRLFREPDNRFLRATDNTTLQDNRKFVTATITPMAGNLGFALYACPPNPAPNSTQSQVLKDTRYAVKLFHNEKGARLYPYERQVYWYDQYRQAFAVTYNQCDLDALCHVSKGAAVKTSVLALLLSMFVSILVIV